MAHRGHTACSVVIGVFPSRYTPPVLAHTGLYPLLSTTTTALLTKGQPWRPEPSIYLGPSSPIAWPPPANAGLHDPHPSVLPFAASTGYPSESQPRIESQCLTPQIPGPIPFEADPLEPAYVDGQMSLAPPNPIPGSKKTTTPTLTFDTPPKWGLFDGYFLSSGAIRVRLAWPRRRQTNRRRTSAKNNQSMLVDHWPTLRPPSIPIPAKIGTLLPPLPGSLHTFSWSLDPNYKIRHDPPPRAEYLFEYSPPHSPLGDLEPLLADQLHGPKGPICISLR
jgi:hypothetical protein